MACLGRGGRPELVADASVDLVQASHFLGWRLGVRCTCKPLLQVLRAGGLVHQFVIMDQRMLAGQPFYGAGEPAGMHGLGLSTSAAICEEDIALRTASWSAAAC